MHRIFKIQDMVDQILSWLPPSTLIATALVNHMWFYSSLPNIWRLVTLSEALTPLQLCTCRKECSVSHQVMFQTSNLVSYRENQCEPPTPQKWARFFVYSQYVRIILGNENDFLHIRKVTQFRHKTVEYLFPNLCSLRWDSHFFGESLPDFTLLISPSLENVGLRLFNLTLPFFRPFCETLANRVQSLRLLQICIDEPSWDTRKCIKSFNKVLESASSTLIHVQLPESFITEETVQALGRIQNLYDLTIGTATFELMFDEGWVCRGSGDENNDGNFGSLVYLLLSGSQRASYHDFLNKPSFSSLAAIEWRECTELRDVVLIATTISNACPRLEILTLGESERSATEEHLPPIVPWETLRVLLRCSLLTELSLHCCRVSMTSDDLVELLTSRLYFTQTPWKTLHIYTVEPLSIPDLLLFAKYCPYLNRLGVHFDGRFINDNALDEIRAQTRKPYIPPPEFLMQYGVSEAQLEHEGPNKLASVLSIDFAFSPLNPDLVHELVECLFEICGVVPSIHGWDPEWEVVSSYLWLKHQNPRRITFVTRDESSETNVNLADYNVTHI
ncbi:hypothetical protein Clacol_007882 [Clathrus columnatus]|uniref:F-box domain-containing protein n=1 Tax=Clathrus columnatus TaxID=1419009 RepID=A0AAV5AMH2_9AGAM|nr:hypothetical protein Clacol_007882 [Clathrus columnatus]